MPLRGATLHARRVAPRYSPTLCRSVGGRAPGQRTPPRRLFADRLVLMTYVEGGPPETEGDCFFVADTLRQLHRLTQAGRSARDGSRRPTS
jgi:hypothetical protein